MWRRRENATARQPHPAAMLAVALAGAVLGQGGMDAGAPRPHPAAMAPAAAVSGSDPATPLRAPALQAALERWLAGQSAAQSVAAGLAITGGDGPVWTGEAHRQGPRLDADDEYGVLSVTKTFTEALVLREVAAGRVALDDPMPTISGLGGADRGSVLTPRMLLQHTSGLANYPNAVGYDPTRPITPEEVVTLALHSPPLSTPGQQANYSNSNFHWLGLLLEEVTGRTYADLVTGLAREVGLVRTRLDPTGRPGWVGYASGGIRSSVADLARWGAALFTPGRVLRARELAGLTTVGDAGVSLGLWAVCPCGIGPDGARRASGLGQKVSHGGLFFYPERQLVVVVRYEPADVAAGEEIAALLAAAQAG